MNKEKITAMLELGLHAFLASGVMQEENKAFFSNMCKSAGVELEIPDSEDKLPPMEDLLKVLDTKVDRVEALNLVIHLFIADGNFTDEERRFLENLYKKLELPENEFENIVKAIEKGVEAERIWLDTRKRLLNN